MAPELWILAIPAIGLWSDRPSPHDRLSVSSQIHSLRGAPSQTRFRRRCATPTRRGQGVCRVLARLRSERTATSMGPHARHRPRPGRRCRSRHGHRRCLRRPVRRPEPGAVAARHRGHRHHRDAHRRADDQRRRAPPRRPRPGFGGGVRVAAHRRRRRRWRRFFARGVAGATQQRHQQLRRPRRCSTPTRRCSPTCPSSASRAPSSPTTSSSPARSSPSRRGGQRRRQDPRRDLGRRRALPAGAARERHRPADHRHRQDRWPDDHHDGQAPAADRRPAGARSAPASRRAADRTSAAPTPSPGGGRGGGRRRRRRWRRWRRRPGALPRLRLQPGGAEVPDPGADQLPAAGGRARADHHPRAQPAVDRHRDLELHRRRRRPDQHRARG